MSTDKDPCSDCCHAGAYHDDAGACDLDGCTCDGYQPMEGQPFTLSVQLHQNDDHWIAQCLECHVAEQGDSPTDALENIRTVLDEHVKQDLLDGAIPLGNIPRPPPSVFRPVPVHVLGTGGAQ